MTMVVNVCFNPIKKATNTTSKGERGTPFLSLLLQLILHHFTINKIVDCGES